jgi:amidophosphoribosyltransferase
MSDALKHECGIALVRLLKPLEYYKENTVLLSTEYKKCISWWKSSSTTVDKMVLVLQIKLDVEPGERYISVRSNNSQPIQDVFCSDQRQNQWRNGVTSGYADGTGAKNKYSLHWRVFLGHVRYGTFGKNSIESVHPFTSKQLDAQKPDFSR